MACFVQELGLLEEQSHIFFFGFYPAIKCKCNAQTLCCRATVGFREVYTQFPVSNIVTVLASVCFITPTDDLLCLVKVVANMGNTQKPLILKRLNLSSCFPNDVISKRFELGSWDWSRIEDNLSQYNMLLFYLLSSKNFIAFFEKQLVKNHVLEDESGKKRGKPPDERHSLPKYLQILLAQEIICISRPIPAFQLKAFRNGGNLKTKNPLKPVKNEGFFRIFHVFNYTSCGQKIVLVDNKIHVGKNRHYFANKKLAAHISKPNSGPMAKGPRVTFAIDGRVGELEHTKCQHWNDGNRSPNSKEIVMILHPYRASKRLCKN